MGIPDIKKGWKMYLTLPTRKQNVIFQKQSDEGGCGLGQYVHLQIKLDLNRGRFCIKTVQNLQIYPQLDMFHDLTDLVRTQLTGTYPA